MKAMLTALAVSISLIISAPLFADEVTADSTEYTFEDDVLVGTLKGTEGARITSRPRGTERSLLKIRTHFVPRMLKSIENI